MTTALKSLRNSRFRQTVAIGLLIGLPSASRLMAMPGPAHDALATILIGTPIEQGGIGAMNPKKIEAINDWIDKPARQTGEFINPVTDSPVCPANHNHLRHNPVEVGHQFSRDASANAAAQNVARLHKIADVANNKVGIDGYESISSSMRREAKGILKFVEKNRRLPAELPKWVDQAGSLIKPVLPGAEQAVGAAAGSAPRRWKPAIPTKGGASALLKASSVLLVADGVLNVDNARKSIRDGKPVEASLYAVQGTLETVAAPLIIKGTVSSLRAAGGAMGVITVAEGARDVYVGCRDGNNELVIVGIVKSAAGTALTVGAATSNPALVVAGAGAYTLVLVYENREQLNQALNATTHYVADTARDVADSCSSLGDAASEAVVHSSFWLTARDAWHYLTH